MARWLSSTADPEQVRCLAGQLAIPEIVARVLVGRGYSDPEQAHRFLNPSLSHLHEPYRMHGMREAVERLRRACSQREKILIYGDYDVDGATAVVLLRKAIDLAGGQADFHIPHRLKDGYGMREQVIEHAARENIRLIISVDTGIRESDVVSRANGLGIDTIITDHHLPDSAAEVPAAVAVLNPNQPGCDYPDKNLCGVGVAFKLAHALLGSLGWSASRLEALVRSLLRVVAIGTVADVVPLTGENRTIVKFGLEGLARPVNHGLRALLSIAGFGNGRPPNAGNIAFWLAPRLNAAGRMDTASQVIELFSAVDAESATLIAGRLDRLNADRQQAEATIVNDILATFAGESAESTSGRMALFCVGERWHRGVLGIVASRLVERFCRPAIVLSIEPEEGLAYGSARSIPGFHLLRALESMAELFVRFGGHRQAAGFTIEVERLSQFRRRFQDYAAETLTAADCIPVIAVDGAITLPEITGWTMDALARIEPCGAGNPEPLFAATGLALAGPPRLLKEKHLRLNLLQKGRCMQAVGWNMAGRIAELQTGGALDAAFQPERDDFNGGWRIKLKDFVMR